jgi:hypothetical protein
MIKYSSWFFIENPCYYLSPIHALKFSIAINCISAGGGTHMLGKVETSKGEILSSVEENQSRDNLCQVIASAMLTDT